MSGWVVIANEPGRHGFDIVGPFDTDGEAEAWRKKHRLSGAVEPQPLVAPNDWRRNSGAMDDGPLVEEAENGGE